MRVVTARDKQGSPTHYTYDSLGRLLQEEIAFQEITQETYHYTVKQYAYDLNGNITTQLVSNSTLGQTLTFARTEYWYNSRYLFVGVVTFDKDGSGNDIPENYTQYYYDYMGNKLRMYTGLSSPLTISESGSVSGGDSNYSVTNYEYDAFGQLTKLIDPLDQVEVYVYDLNGHLLEKHDRNGSTTTYGYDPAGRMLSSEVTNIADPTINDSHFYTYYLTGSRASMTTNSQETSYEYDSLGRLTKETTPEGVVKQYSYDTANNRKSLSITVDGQPPATTITTYTYDNLNRLATVTDGDTVATYTYDIKGNRASLTYSNGNTTEYGYNLANRLTALTNMKGTEVLSQYTYEYLLDGNQVSKLEPGGKTTTYTYDGLGRLTSETVVEGQPQNTTTTLAVTYTYDYYNNRATKTLAGGPTTTYAYDKNNRLLLETASLGDVETITRYTYDPNGNQIVKLVEVISPEVIGETETLAISLVGQPETTGIVFYQYNGFNRLVKVIDGDTVASYQYNGDGLRTRKEVNGLVTVHIWDGNQIAMELNGAGSVTHRYVRGINLLFAQAGATQTFYLYNGHGDVVQLTGTTGIVTKSYDYDAFGIELNPDPLDINVFRYCGEYFDRETGTIYLRARYYSPVIGRFITEDTYRGKENDPLSLNLYVYC